MPRIRWRVGAAIALVLVATTPAAARLCGDADANGRVTLADGVNVLRASADLSSPCDETCDVDGSGGTTVVDGVMVLRVAADLPVPDACGDVPCVFGTVTIADNLEIPTGFDCVLDGTRIEGNLVLKTDAGVAAAAIFVTGNVEGQEAFALRLLDSDVEGNVQFERSGRVTIENSSIGGNLQLQGNVGDLFAAGNEIGGDLQAFDNQGGALIEFTANTIDGNLQCQNNAPLPTGGENLVFGDVEDQCIGL